MQLCRGVDELGWPETRMPARQGPEAGLRPQLFHPPMLVEAIPRQLFLCGSRVITNSNRNCGSLDPGACTRAS
jgi:hypothetical protein